MCEVRVIKSAWHALGKGNQKKKTMQNWIVRLSEQPLKKKKNGGLASTGLKKGIGIMPPRWQKGQKF